MVPVEMSSPQTTGKWEKGLSSISKGNMTEEKFMASIRRYVQFLIRDAASGRRADVVFPEEQIRGKRRKNNAFGKCPVCGRDILENTKSFYCAGWKQGCKFSLWKDSLTPYGLTLDGGMVKLLLLTLVTFGIYPLFFYAGLADDVNAICSRYDGKKTMFYLWVLLLTPLGGIVPLVWFHRISKRIGNELERRGVPYKFGAADYWLWSILGAVIVIGPFVYIHKLLKAMNRLCENYNVKG